MIEIDRNLFEPFDMDALRKGNYQYATELNHSNNSDLLSIESLIKEIPADTDFKRYYRVSVSENSINPKTTPDNIDKESN